MIRWLNSPAKGVCMFVFHRLIRTRAPSARSVRRFVHSPIRPHDPQFLVHKIKTRNHFSNHNLANSPPPNLLQMHQTRNRTPQPTIFQSRNTAQAFSQRTTNHKQQSHDETKPPIHPRNPLATSQTPFSASRSQYFLTKRSQTSPAPPPSSFKSSSLHVSDRATPPWSLELGHSLVIAHWTLVIPPVATRDGAASVSLAKNLIPNSHNTLPTTINTVVNTNPTSIPCAGLLGSWNRPAINPISGGEIASPSVWMIKMFKANAVARTAGCVTLAKIVLVGPALKNRKKTVKNKNTHAYGNGTFSISRKLGTPSSMATPLTRKYEPENRLRSMSPANPPPIVANNPPSTTTPPKIVRASMPCTGATPRVCK